MIFVPGLTFLNNWDKSICWSVLYWHKKIFTGPAIYPSQYPNTFNPPPSVIISFAKLWFVHFNNLPRPPNRRDSSTKITSQTSLQKLYQSTMVRFKPTSHSPCEPFRTLVQGTCKPNNKWAQGLYQELGESLQMNSLVPNTYLCITGPWTTPPTNLIFAVADILNQFHGPFATLEIVFTSKITY